MFQMGWWWWFNPPTRSSSNCSFFKTTRKKKLRGGREELLLRKTRCDRPEVDDEGRYFQVGQIAGKIAGTPKWMVYSL